MPPTSPAKPGRSRVSLLGLIQLAICLLALWWVWQNAASAPADQFWGVVALALFAGGLAQINLVGPLWELFSPATPTTRLALPVRLYPDGTSRGLEWPMFSLALAFGTPFVPLLRLILSEETSWIVELHLIWIGLAFLSLFVAGIGFYLGGRALYKRLVGGQTLVEVETDTAQAGQTLSGFVWHQAGRIPVESIEVVLTARQTLTQRIRGQQADGQSHKIETTILHREVVCPTTMVELTARPWQKHFSFTIPDDALSSAPHPANPMIIWSLDVHIILKGAPDFNLTFPLTVVGAPVAEYDEEEIEESVDQMDE